MRPGRAKRKRERVREMVIDIVWEGVGESDRESGNEWESSIMDLTWPPGSARRVPVGFHRYEIGGGLLKSKKLKSLPGFILVFGRSFKYSNIWIYNMTRYSSSSNRLYPLSISFYSTGRDDSIITVAYYHTCRCTASLAEIRITFRYRSGGGGAAKDVGGRPCTPTF